MAARRPSKKRAAPAKRSPAKRAPAKRAAPKPSKKPAADSLSTYRAKRDFSKTPEPQGAAVPHGSRLIVQHHFARRDHYDLRLEVDGVLKSWAVTRGPSANPKDRRLAVRTEDHPLDYAEFEGTIPQGEYGGGTVILWEYATFEPMNGDPGEAIDNGEIKFLCLGERMRGRWVLVRLKSREKRENWLLIKERDDFVEPDDGLVARFPASVKTGRTREEIERGAPAKRTTAKKSNRQVEKVPLPAFVPPMLCSVAEAPPTQEGWRFEMKYDGYRLQLAIGGGDARVYTRAGLDWTRKFAAIAEAASALNCRSALIDGEGVVFDAQGVSDFAALVAALENGHGGAIEFMAFDLLELDGESLRGLPLTERKKRLEKLLSGHKGALRYAAHVEGQGAQVFAKAVEAGAEGIIAKKAASRYVSDRSPNWLKIKADRREDVLVIGWMKTEKSDLFASLLTAIETPDGLTFTGRVGTGYDAATKKAIWPKLKETVATPPADLLNPQKLPKKTNYLKNPFRAEIRFRGWTGDGLMRQASFIGLREDRPGRDRKPSPAPAGLPVKPARKTGQEAAPLSPITHAERVIFPESGVTKGEVAAYYAAVAERMALHLEGRPVSLIRAPDGIAGEKFFQRHPLKGMMRGIVDVPDSKEGGVYMALDGATGLHTAAQFGAIEIHGWMSRKDRLEFPDRAIFDLDPDEGLDFAEVKKAARDIARHLDGIGLASWPMLTGGKGVHVVAPLDRSLDYPDVEAFAEGFAKGLARDEPERFVATMSKAKRTGRIFVDWLRNKRTATAILPWSLRARAGAPVAVPVSWAALGRIKAASAYDISSAVKLKDPWTDFFERRQTIPAQALAFLRERVRRGG